MYSLDSMHFYVIWIFHHVDIALFSLYSHNTMQCFHIRLLSICPNVLLFGSDIPYSALQLLLGVQLCFSDAFNHPLQLILLHNPSIQNMDCNKNA
jgi:hypothetical protein